MKVKRIDFRERPLAIVDVETTGDESIVKHEILEIGLLIVNQKTLDILDRANWLVEPEHIETAMPKALERNGYKEELWVNAQKLSDVMKEFSEKTENAIFVSYNVWFDWPFINEAFRKTGVKNLMDYHAFDLLTLAWFMGGEKLERLNLKTVSEFFGVPPEPDPHRAINGSETALEVLKAIKKL